MGSRSLAAPGPALLVATVCPRVRRRATSEGGDIDAARSRHAAYYLALAEEAEPALWGPTRGHGPAGWKPSMRTFGPPCGGQESEATANSAATASAMRAPQFVCQPAIPVLIACRTLTESPTRRKREVRHSDGRATDIGGHLAPNPNSPSQFSGWHRGSRTIEPTSQKG